MYQLKLNNLLVDVEIFSFVINKLYFKQSFNSISRIRGNLFSQINFDQTFFFLGGELCPGGFWHGGILSRGFCLGVDVRGGLLSGGLCPRTNEITSHPSLKRRHIVNHHEYSLCAKRFSHHFLLSSNRKVSKCRSRM